MPITNGCNLYDWGAMDATWEGYCMASEEEEPETSDCTDCVTQSQYDELYSMVMAQQETIEALEAEVESLAGLEETVTEVDQAVMDMATCMAAYVSSDDDTDEEPEPTMMEEETTMMPEDTMPEDTMEPTKQPSAMMTTSEPTMMPTEIYMAYSELDSFVCPSGANRSFKNTFDS